MKKKRFKLTTFSLLIASLLCGQADLQWLIWNARGKEGVISATATNNYANALTSSMTFSGVAIPNTDSDPDPRNDLFIIYSDGTYQNTRNVSGLNTFFSGTSSPSVTSVSFSAPSGINILYGYLTNIYEGDDLPSGVRVNSTAGSSPIALGVTTPTHIISANHEVVFNKDITLIIDNASLLQFPDSNGLESDTYTLVFDGVQEIATSAITTGVNFLDPKNIFGSSTLFPLYPLPSVSPVAGESISLDPTSGPYSYVNLRPNSGATSYQPDRNGTPLYKAIFTVYKNNEIVDQLPEPLRFSHDPNFLQVIDICNISAGGYMVTYHLEFENTSPTPSEHQHIAVDFPSHFDLSCIRAVNWSAKGNPCGGRLDPDTKVANRIIFDIQDHQLIRCTNVLPDQGKGFIEFKVKVNPAYNVRDISNSLELINPNVFFDSIPYLITDFRDLIECENRQSNVLAFTHKPTVSKNPEPEKGDTKKVTNEDNHDPKGKMHQLLPQLVNGPRGLAHVCSRPISDSPCNCLYRFPWLYVWGGLIASALIVFVISRIIRKKPTPPQPPVPPER